MGEGYDGPAVVVRSNSGELVLESPPAGAGGSGGAPAPAGGRLIVTSTAPLATFPAGAQVWLAKTRGPAPPLGHGPPVPGTFSVRDRRAGTLLLGANDDLLPEPLSPVKIGEITVLCSTPRSDRCVSMEAHYALAFIADTPVVVRDGEPAEIMLGGVTYDVRVSAWRQILHSPIPDGCVGDGISWPDGFEFDVQAKNLADLVAGLTVVPR